MTAEVVVMNKLAVAVAADSAVTIRLPEGNKIYQSANKLFGLSDDSSAGIMFYGNAEFMEVPWESIVKVFREELRSQTYPTLNGYSDKFLRFLRSNRNLFPADAQRRYVRAEAMSFLFAFSGELIEGIRERLQGKSNIKESQVKRTLTFLIKSRLAEVRTLNAPTSLPSNYAKTIITKYSRQISEAIDETYEDIPLSTNGRRYLRELVSEVLHRTYFRIATISGIVFAGFGDKDVFPKVIEFHTRGIADNKLWYLPARTVDIERGNESTIAAFAQGEMVSTFMEGIDPQYREFMRASLEELFKAYVDKISAAVPSLNSAQRKKLKTSLEKATQKHIEQFNQGLDAYRIAKHVQPVISMISALPKEELARVAEALVNLTSFKRRVSAESETVSEPIDVAVISKGDGFVWIKRKRYFTLN